MLNNKKLHAGFKILNRGGELFNYIKIKDGNVYFINTTGTDTAIVNVGKADIDDGSHQIKSNLNDIQKGLRFFKGEGSKIEVIPNHTVKLTSGNKTVVIDIDTNTLNIDYEIDSTTTFNFDFKDFKRRFESVVPLKANNETRPNIHGLHFNENHLVTLDGYKMAVSIDNKSGNKLPPVTIQGSTVNYLGDIMKAINNYNDLNVRYDGTRIEFEMENVKLVSRVYDGDYFKYKDIIRPAIDDSTTIKNVDVKGLLDDIKFLESMSNEGRFVGDEIRGYTREKDLVTANNQVKLNYDISGLYLDIAFNLKFMRVLLIALSKVNKKTTLGFMGELNPIFFRNENSIYLLLPIRMK